MARGWSRGFVKICGISTVEEAQGAVAGGADGVGLILADSPRRVTADRAREICDAVAGTALRFAVFRHAPSEEVLDALSNLEVDLVQLHGVYDGDLVDEISQRGLRTIRALTIGSSEFYTFDDPRVAAVLIDGPQPGSGVPHSWAPLAEREFAVPVIVAGGITPDSVAHVVAETNAWGVDCSSGVESSPGRKDMALVNSFVKNARRGFGEGE